MNKYTKERLELLPTKLNYAYFDEGSGKCNRFSYYSSAKKELDRHPELQDVSDKILKAVCYVYNKSKLGNLDVRSCNFLYFWLGNKLLNNLQKKHFFEEAIIGLFRNLNENDTRKVCTLPYTYMEEGHFEKIKLIYDYFEDYENYKIDLAIHNRSCNEDYYTYLKAYVDKYKQLYDECITEHQPHMYCEVFRKKYDKKKHANLYYLSCNLEKNLSETDPLPGELKDAEHPKKLDDRPNGEALEAKVQQRLTMAPHEHVEIPASLGNNLDDITPGRTITSEDKTTSITSKSITGAVSVAGFLVPSYLMYNYTSAGTWINKVLGRKKRTNFNPYTDQYLMENISGPENFYSERSKYNISYRPE
ncbi:Plasmodium vivax Vir protein, putative [Plasmodium vivax]|uniref:Vir protein, putative n=1 Tax=Plasmodium vivax TaxID=5855 RepID=A0A1G4E960_PLAVI|nr:Plasmodium vivax Vir protein, putative [Plasmodium vivax]